MQNKIKLRNVRNYSNEYVVSYAVKDCNIFDIYEKRMDPITGADLFVKVDSVDLEQVIKDSLVGSTLDDVLKAQGYIPDLSDVPHSVPVFEARDEDALSDLSSIRRVIDEGLLLGEDVVSNFRNTLSSLASTARKATCSVVASNEDNGGVDNA